MKPNILTRERLSVIWRAIDKNGGKVSVRHLMRNHGLFRSVIHEAIDSGFLTLEIQKPPRGRPSHVLKKVNECYPTILTPSHFDLDRLISHRHWKFAFHYAMGEIGPGMFDFKRRAWVAYKKSFPSDRSDGGA